MGLLDGGLRATFYSAFQGIFLDASLYVPTTVRDAGDDVTLTWGDAIAIKAVVEACSEEQKRDPDYTKEDVQLIILQGSVPVRITTEHQITVRGVRYKLGGPIRQDPAQATWNCRGTPAQPVPA